MLWPTVKLSKFISPSTDDVSVHCCVDHLVVCKMATVQEHARCVAWLFGTKSVIQTKQNNLTHLNKPPLRDAPVRYWQRRFPNPVTSMIFLEVLWQLRLMMWSDFKNHLQEALQINTKSFARTGRSTCHRT